MTQQADSQTNQAAGQPAEAPTLTQDNSSAAPQGETPEAGAENRPAEDPKFSSKFAALSRRDKELRAKERAIKERETAYREWQEQQRLIKENPLAFMEKSGLTLEQLITLSLQRPEAVDPVKAELEQVKAKISDWDKQYEQVLQQQREAAEAQAEADSKAAIRSVVEAAGDKYELVAANEAIDEVYDLILQDWLQQEGAPEERRPMPIEKAAQLVEDYYFEAAQKLLKANKVRAAIKQPGSQEETDQGETATGDRAEGAGDRSPHPGGFNAAPQRQDPQPGSLASAQRPGLAPTLANGRTAAPLAGAPKRDLSTEESLKRAVSLLKFT